LVQEELPQVQVVLLLLQGMLIQVRVVAPAQESHIWWP
jgi:hypothetical protein